MNKKEGASYITTHLLVMKQAGFELTRSNGKRGYRVVELPRN